MVELVQAYPALAIACAGVLGLLVGSFLNVVILRLPLRMQWQWEREARELLQEVEAGSPGSEQTLVEPSLLGLGKSAEPGRSAEPGAAGQASAWLGLPGLDLAAEPGASAEQAPLYKRLDESEPAAPPGIVVEGSHCLHCGHRLAAWENIPLLSFILLGGKCRACKARISWQYPLVEALTGILFALVVWRYGLTWQSGALLVATGFLVAMSGIDARTTLLPDSLTLPLLWFGLLLSLGSVFVPPAEAILGAVVGYLSLWSVYWGFKLLTGKEGMGHGDFKLLAAIGAFCGWTAILPVVLMSSLIGAIVGIALITIQGRDRATPIPFGPYLAAAGWVQMLYGGDLLAKYLQFVAGI